MLRLRFLIFLLISKFNSKFIDNDFKYIPPTYSVKNPNITTGSVFAFSVFENETVLASPDVFHSLGTVCAMKGYNDGKLQKDFNLQLQAEFNLDSYSVSLVDNTEGYQFMALMRTNLVYKSNGSSASAEKYLSNIGVVMDNSITFWFTDYIPFYVGLPIPTINYGFAPFSTAYFPTSTLERRNGKDYYFELSAPTGANFLSATKQLLTALNWTLVAPIFSQDDFGYYGEKFLQSAQFTVAGITAVCPTSIPDFLFLPGAERTLEVFISCIANVDNLSVIWLWMNAASAYGIIKWFRDRGYSKLNFVIYVQKETELISFAEPDLLTNVITFIPFAGPVVKQSFDSCVADLDDKTYYGQLGKFVYECINNGTGTFPHCNLNNPQQVCTCNQTLSDLYKNNLVILKENNNY